MAALAVAPLRISRPEDPTNLSSDCPAFSHWGFPVMTTAKTMVRVAHRSRWLREALEETILEEVMARVRGQVGGPSALDRGAAQHTKANALASLVARVIGGPQNSGGGANDAAPEGGPRQRIAAMAGREDLNAYLVGVAARLRGPAGLTRGRSQFMCERHGCPRRAAAHCGGFCASAFCTQHLRACGRCGRGPFCSECAPPTNHTCVPERSPPGNGQRASPLWCGGRSGTIGLAGRC